DADVVAGAAVLGGGDERGAHRVRGERGERALPAARAAVTERDDLAARVGERDVEDVAPARDRDARALAEREGAEGGDRRARAEGVVEPDRAEPADAPRRHHERAARARGHRGIARHTARAEALAGAPAGGVPLDAEESAAAVAHDELEPPAAAEQ